jgi:hypothetical protein
MHLRTSTRAALASGTIVTMLPSSPQVKSAYGGGIIPALMSLGPEHSQNTLCIDSTTLDVAVAREVAMQIDQTKARIVDAPVSGGNQLNLCICPFKLGLLTCVPKSFVCLFRCHWCEGRHACFSCRRDRYSIQAFRAYFVYDGSTDYSLWPIRSWPYSKNMQ